MSTKAQAKLEAKLRERLLSVFVSYSTKDLQLARSAAAVCSGNGVRTFLAEDDLRVGEELPKALARQIADSDVLVLLWSENAAESDWVRREIDHATGSGVRVLPVVIGSPERLPNHLRRIKYADARLGLEAALAGVRAFADQMFEEKTERRLHNDLVGVGAFVLGALVLAGALGGKS